MDSDLIVATIAAMLNIILSLVIPPLLKNSTLPFATQIKKNYNCNRDIIIVSSVLTIIFVYVSLKITPWVRTNVFTNLAKLGANKK
jgi:hypothetical protein